MGSLLAGPFCGQLLADFGAEVIKVGRQARGPHARVGPPPQRGTHPLVAHHRPQQEIRHHQLAGGGGQDLARRLISEADVVVENFRPGTLEKWGLGYEDLGEINPGLVMVRVSGYGQTGPYKDQAGFGSIGEAMGGIRHVTGYPDRPPPRVGISLGDSLAATFGALGAVTALYNRESAGEGQIVDVGIYEAVLALMESTIPEYARRPRPRAHRGHPALRGAVEHLPHRRRRLRRDRRQRRHRVRTVRGGGTSRVGRGGTVCDPPRPRREPGRAGRPDLRLDQPTKRGRGARGNERGERPCRQLFTAEDMLSDEQYAARQNIVTVEDPEIGPFPMQNVVPRLSETPGEVRWTGPKLGQHNDEVFKSARDARRRPRRSAGTGHRLMHIEIVDVGPRDGLQNEDKTLSPSPGRALREARRRRRPRRGRQLRQPETRPADGRRRSNGAIERSPHTSYAGLVLNEKGYERAIEAGVDEVRYAFPVTETFAKRNQNTTIRRHAARRAARGTGTLDGVRVSITLSAAFGDPSKDGSNPSTYSKSPPGSASARRDRTGRHHSVGVPARCEARRGRRTHGITVGCHFHDTRNTGIANAAAAVESGATVLDASVGARAAAPSPPAPQATSPQKTSSTSCTTWATTRE